MNAEKYRAEKKTALQEAKDKARRKRKSSSELIGELAKAVPWGEDGSEDAGQLSGKYFSVKQMIDDEPPELMLMNGGLPLHAPAAYVFRSLLEEGEGVPVAAAEEFRAYIYSCFTGCKIERLVLFPVTDDLLAKRGRIIAEGSHRQVEAVCPLIVNALDESGCNSYILAHNHLFRSSPPSESDLRSTRELNERLSEMKYCLLDHFVVSPDGIVSLREMGWDIEVF